MSSCIGEDSTPRWGKLRKSVLTLWENMTLASTLYQMTKKLAEFFKQTFSMNEFNSTNL